MTQRTWCFNFKDLFAGLVESQKKLQTIRADRKDKRRPTYNDPVKLYKGLRTKGTRLLGVSTISSVDNILIDFQRREIHVAGVVLSRAEAEQLARADGFDSQEAMIHWFVLTHGQNRGRYFNGFMVRWRPFTSLTPGSPPSQDGCGSKG